MNMGLRREGPAHSSAGKICYISRGGDFLMSRKDIAGLNHLTKRQWTEIGQLGSEWVVLDSADNLINKLIRKQHESLRPGTKRPPELVELEKQQWEIFRAKREISAELVEREKGLRARPRRPGRKSKPFILARNTFIRASEHRRDKDIARELDLQLAQRNMPPLGLPESWTEKYGVRSYYEAYRHLKCKPLVQKLISAAKAA
jgi:hypothetical protein